MQTEWGIRADYSKSGLKQFLNIYQCNNDSFTSYQFTGIEDVQTLIKALNVVIENFEQE